MEVGLRPVAVSGIGSNFNYRQMPQYNRLTREQRYAIEILLSKGARPAEIARILSLSASSVNRETRRGGIDSPI